MTFRILSYAFLVLIFFEQIAVTATEVEVWYYWSTAVWVL